MKLIIPLIFLIVASTQQIAASPGKCAFPLKHGCITQIPAEWQIAKTAGAIPFTVEEVCLSFSDYQPDPNLCTMSGSIKLGGDIAAYVSGIVAQHATVHRDDLDQWVKAAGLQKGDAHTIRTITYMQADSYHRLWFYKGSADEWHPDVKCSITLDNPEPPTSCRAKQEPTPSAGMFKLSAQCNFSENKNRTLTGDLGQILIGALTGPIGIYQSIPGLFPAPSDVPPLSRSPGLPTGGALEVAFDYTCPDDVQSLDDGAKLLITRSSNAVDYYQAKKLADQWNQESALASHLLGDVPKNITAARGDSYWHFAEQYYSSGRYWIGIAEANNWRKLIPGSSVELPPMQQLLFGPCFVRERESLWKAGIRLNEPAERLEVASTDWLVRPEGRNSVYPLEKLNISVNSNCQN